MVCGLRAPASWVLLLCAVLSACVATGCGEVRLGRHACWACDGSMGIAPNPKETREALVQLYGARTYRWHGIFAVHTWVAYKPKNATDYTAIHVVRRWGFPGEATFRIFRDPHPDKRWHGAAPALLYELQGEAAEAAIPKIQEAVNRYPLAYRIWPGPNSNTFTANIVREVPELKAELPPTAIGKDFLSGGQVLARAPSGTGFQVSLFGVLGFLVAIEEGVEVNLLGLNFGIDLIPPAVKVPLFGRIGIPQESTKSPGRGDFRELQASSMVQKEHNVPALR